jgi:RNA 2',3'-cyclic 3'-phosphodiesterase
MGTRRLFIAIPVPLAVVDTQPSLTEPATSPQVPTIKDLLTRLDSVGKPLRTVPVENLHLTLKFLGNTNEELQNAVSRVLVSVAESEPRFSIAFCGLGTFPDIRRPSVVWAGVSSADPCVRLATACDHFLEPLGFEPEPRPYRPHLTLARVKQPLSDDRLKNLVTQMDDVELATLDVTEIALMESTPSPSGVAYRKLQSARLSGC